MTIDILFMATNKLVNMGCSNFWCKILPELTDEELEKWIPILTTIKRLSIKSLSKRFRMPVYDTDTFPKITTSWESFLTKLEIML